MWNQGKEAKLKRLVEEHATLQSERDAAIGNLVVLIEKIRDVASPPGQQMTPLEQTANFVRALVNYADELRDRLEPFDSGIRPAMDRQS